MNDEHIVTVTILNRSYKIKCPPNQAQALHQAAKQVDQKMRQTKQQGNINNPERLAIVSALNFCHEMMQLQVEYNNYNAVLNQRIKALENRIEKAMSAEESVV